MSKQDLLDLILVDIDWNVSVDVDYQIRLGKTRRATTSFFLPKTIAITTLFEVLDNIKTVKCQERINKWVHNLTKQTRISIRYKWTICDINVCNQVFPHKFIQRTYADEHHEVNFDLRNGDLCGGYLTPISNDIHPVVVVYDWEKQKVTVRFYFTKSKCDIDANGKVEFTPLRI